MRIGWLSLIVVLGVGCNPFAPKTGNRGNPETYTKPIEIQRPGIPAMRNLDPSEILAGKQICGAIKGTRERFSTRIGKKFFFKISYKGTKGELEQHPEKGFILTTDFRFHNDNEEFRTPYFENFESIERGLLRAICLQSFPDGIRLEDSVSNWVVNQEAHELFVFRPFSLDAGIKAIEVIWAHSKENNGKMDVYARHLLKVDVTQEMLGLVRSHQLEKWFGPKTRSELVAEFLRLE